MFRQILLFELRYQLKRPLLWLVAFFFALMTFGATSSDSVQIGGAIGNVHRNAPFVIVQMLGFMSAIGIFITTIFVAGAILRDFDSGTHELFFSRPVKKRDYLLGRFVGACLVSFTAFLGTAVGMFAGSLMPWIDPERLGPIMLSPYVFGLAVLAFPTLLFSACVFFSLASLSRSMLYTYLGVVAFFALFSISGTMLADLDNQYLAAMADPFGIGALQEATKYWTIVERNSELPPIGGVLLHNRLLWTAVGLVVLAFSLSRFRISPVQRRRKRRWWPWRRKGAVEAPAGAALPAGLPVVARDFTVATALRQFLYQTRVEVMGVLKGVPFLVILAFGILNLAASSGFLNQILGTPVWPVTQVMLDLIQGSFTFLLVIIITFYSGELIWRERSVKLSEVYDAMPAPNWVYLGAKLMAQLAVVVAFLIAGVITAMAVQLYHGYTNFELPVYAQGFVVIIVPFLLICFLASFFQVASGKKFVGYMFMILYLVSSIVLTSLDFDHNLYAYAGAPFAQFSDMNGYGHFVTPMFWFYLYWSFCAAVLTLLATLLWVRGTDTAWKLRLKIARERFRGPVRLALAAATLGFVATGAWIFYNTNVLNEYLPSDKVEARQADYEKKFRQYKDVALPRVTDVQVDVDIFPRERRVEARGRYLLVNRNDQPLEEFHVTVPARVTVNSLGFSRRETNGESAAQSETLRDDEHGYTIYQLDQPLAPGAEMEMRFDLTIDNPGFRNNGSDTLIVYNGTFFNNRQYFPSFGYNEGAQLLDRNLRRKYDLPPVHRAAKVDDLFARRNSAIAIDSDWIDFETTVSTSADQIAIAPGYLQREWTEGGRRYFHYKMDSPILHFYAYLSADYEVKRDQHGDVAIEIYYHSGHDYNLDRMIDSIKKSLDYFEANFSPYQHRQMRILEFPRYASFAQSFPNTVPFSEAIGFIARLDDDEDALDYPFYVTSHEVAHQWWAHQVIGGNVQGATLLMETLSQYSALMVMEKEYGPEKMRRFLKHELDRYLRGRAGELVEEMPILLVENQPYIHYRKGSLIMYALRDYIGEEPLNRALAAYTEAVKFQMPPYTNTLEFFDYLKQEVPGDQMTLLADLFENITLFENRVEDASYAERADGKYAVTVVAKARKVRADGQGIETEIPIDDWIEIGVFGEKEENGKTEETVLFLEKRRITEADVTFELVVDEKPVRAGIDPYNKLVDRNSDDNVKKVSQTKVADLGGGASGD